MAMVQDVSTCKNKRCRNAFSAVEKTIRSIALGRIDCQTPVRAKRSMVELVNEEASLISERSENFKVCEAAEEIVRHTMPQHLDRWEAA
ncbi:MAG: hypothetical protein F6K48_03285 [Okeania sp. SIO3H1]|nr:hypothetical protein [Okeania sp. SIO3H1]